MKYISNLIITLFFLLPFYSNAQNIDSLKQSLDLSMLQTEKAEILKEISNVYFFKNLDSSLVYCNLWIELAIKNESVKVHGQALYTKAKIFNAKGMHNEANVFVLESKNLYKSVDYKKGIAQCFNVQANIQQNMQNYDLANEYYDTTLILATQLKDSLLIANSYQGLGITCDYRGQFAKAIEHYFKGIEIFEALGDDISVGKVYSNIGIVYLNIKEYEKSLDYFYKSIALKRKRENHKGLALTYDNIAALHIEKKEYELAEIVVDSALIYANKINADKQISLLHYRKGSILQGRGFKEEALLEYKKGINLSNKIKDDFYTAVGQINVGQLLCSMGKINEGKVYLDNALRYAEEVGFLQMEQSILNSYTHIYRDDENYQELTKRYDRLIAVNDSLYASEKFSIISEIEAKYQTEKKESENKLLQQEKQIQTATINNQRTTMYGGLIGIALLSILSFVLYRQNRERKKHNKELSKKNEKIELLHKELSHRVKNNLAFVSSLMKMQGRRLENKEAKEAVKEGKTRIDTMSLLHRKLFIQEDSSDINIQEYLEELCANLEHTYPFVGSKPEINLLIDDVLVDGEMGVRIGLIINELVTNSFKYAFEHESNPKINIKLQIEDQEIKLSYKDNGIGISESINLSQTKSLGLKLINMLTKQLKGTMQIQNDNGANFQFQFRKTKNAV